jgi:hypothetical protein
VNGLRSHDSFAATLRREFGRQVLAYAWRLLLDARGVEAPMAYNLAFDRLSSLERLYLLSAPLTMPLICCQIKRFRRASRCGEAMTRRRKEARRAGSASQGLCSAGVVAPPVCGYRGIPARGVVPDRCHSAGAAVDVCSDALAWAQRAEHAADGGGVDVSRTRSVSPRAPRIIAQRVARCDLYNTRNCLQLKKLH